MCDWPSAAQSIRQTMRLTGYGPLEFSVTRLSNTSNIRSGSNRPSCRYASVLSFRSNCPACDAAAGSIPAEVNCLR